MYYRSLAFTLALAFPALACAGNGSQAPASDQETDIKVNCIVDFVTSELDESQHDAFIAECVQKKLEDLKGGDSR
jgi:hypothetical protein